MSTPKCTCFMTLVSSNGVDGMVRIVNGEISGATHHMCQLHKAAEQLYECLERIGKGLETGSLEDIYVQDILAIARGEVKKASDEVKDV